MSDPKLIHDALSELDRVVRDFRAREGVGSDFALETHPELGRSLLDLDIEQYVEEFGHVTTAYQTGVAGDELPAEAGLARSLIPPGTGRMRDFSYVGREIPEYLPENCVACMDCVTECPDTAILAKVLESRTFEEADRRRRGFGRARAAIGRRPGSSTTPSRRAARSPGSSGSSSIPPSARDAASAWRCAATTRRCG